jgi:hypothetical protein
LGDVDATLVVAHQTPPSGHPAETSLHNPSARQNCETDLFVGAANDLDGEGQVGRLVHELKSVIGAVCEQMLHPRPALANAIEYGLGAGAVGNVGGRNVDHQQGAIGIHGDMALAADDLLAAVKGSDRAGRRGLHRLAIDYARRRAGLATRRLAVEHQFEIVDRLE